MILRLITITLEGICAQYEKAEDPYEKDAFAEKYQEVFAKLLDKTVEFANIG
jgi:hypothetical protein